MYAGIHALTISIFINIVIVHIIIIIIIIIIYASNEYFHFKIMIY